MFAKLLKHEWRSTVGGPGGLCAAILSLGALSAACVTILFTNAGKLNDLTVGSLTLSLLFINLAIILCAVAAGILLLVRFYRSRFTDQGYLTFTLPVKTHQILGATWLNMLIWTVISAVVVMICTAMMVFTATSASR